MRWKATLLVALLLTCVTAADATARTGSDRQVGGMRVMPGGRVVGGSIVYHHGAVIVHPASEALSFDSCPSGTVCLFAAPSWSGAMVQLNANDCCAWINLASVGFNNTAESWRNRMGDDAEVAMNTDGGGSHLCLNNNSYDGQMSATWSNSASSVRVRSISGLC